MPHHTYLSQPTRRLCSGYQTRAQLMLKLKASLSAAYVHRRRHLAQIHNVPFAKLYPDETTPKRRLVLLPGGHLRHPLRTSLQPNTQVNGALEWKSSQAVSASSNLLPRTFHQVRCCWHEAYLPIRWKQGPGPRDIFLPFCLLLWS